jgi:hypothetical protein
MAIAATCHDGAVPVTAFFPRLRTPVTRMYRGATALMASHIHIKVSRP